MSIPDNAKSAARELMRTWGDRPRIVRHWDDGEQNFVDIASCDGSPTTGVTAIGTVGLSSHDLGLGPVRVELVGAFPSDFDHGANVAATCAFNAFKDGLPTRPDSIHPRVIELYRPTSTTPHVLLTDPFLWENGPETIGWEDLSIAWLMMVPISEDERRFALAHGAAALTTLFEARQIDVFDLDRASVV